jgi:hypothetical protein
LVFGFEFETTSDQKDSACLKKRILWRRRIVLCIDWKSGGEGIVANAPRTRKYPGLPAGRAEHFPVKGELCLRATFPIFIR